MRSFVLMFLLMTVGSIYIFSGYAVFNSEIVGSGHRALLVLFSGWTLSFFGFLVVYVFDFDVRKKDLSIGQWLNSIEPDTDKSEKVEVLTGLFIITTLLSIILFITN